MFFSQSYRFFRFRKQIRLGSLNEFHLKSGSSRSVGFERCVVERIRPRTRCSTTWTTLADCRCARPPLCQQNCDTNERDCPDLKQNGKNQVKAKKLQVNDKDFGMIQKIIKVKEKIPMHFANSFKVVRTSKITHKFQLIKKAMAGNLRKPTLRKIVDFLGRIIARFGKKRCFRTDPGSSCLSNRFNECCSNYLIGLRECPLGDHIMHGLFERCVRLIERRSADKG